MFDGCLDDAAEFCRVAMGVKADPIDELVRRAAAAAKQAEAARRAGPVWAS